MQKKKLKAKGSGEIKLVQLELWWDWDHPSAEQTYKTLVHGVPRSFYSSVLPLGAGAGTATTTLTII